MIIHRKMWKMWSSSLKRFSQIWLTTNQPWSSNLESSFHIYFCYTLKSKYRNLMIFFSLTSCEWNLPKSFHFLFHFWWSFADKLWHWLVNKHVCDCRVTSSLILQRTNQKIRLAFVTVFPHFLPKYLWNIIGGNTSFATSYLAK